MILIRKRWNAAYPFPIMARKRYPDNPWFQRGESIFFTGGPGVRKTHFLKQLAYFLRKRWTAPGAVVVVASTGSAARSASGQTFHSFLGFVRDYSVKLDDPAAEAARLLKMGRWVPIALRLTEVRALLIDEISMVSTEKLDVVCEMVRQTQTGAPSKPCARGGSTRPRWRRSRPSSSRWMHSPLRAAPPRCPLLPASASPPAGWRPPPPMEHPPACPVRRRLRRRWRRRRGRLPAARRCVSSPAGTPSLR